jgi:transposase-like protein
MICPECNSEMEEWGVSSYFCDNCDMVFVNFTNQDRIDAKWWDITDALP